jgi:hypothetical protein
MVSVVSLWLPILLSAVIVFIVSSVIHMVLGYHRSDFVAVPKEDEVMAALRPFEIPPGDYCMPYSGSMAAMKDAAFVEKMKAGPIALITVLPNGPVSIGSSLVLWFIYSILVSIIAGYVAGSALPRGADYLAVFRIAGCVAFTGYSLALFQNSIWNKRKWSATLKAVFDGLVYGLVTAGAFGWLWPR